MNIDIYIWYETPLKLILWLCTIPSTSGTRCPRQLGHMKMKGWFICPADRRNRKISTRAPCVLKMRSRFSDVWNSQSWKFKILDFSRHFDFSRCSTIFREQIATFRKMTKTQKNHMHFFSLPILWFPEIRPDQKCPNLKKKFNFLLQLGHHVSFCMKIENPKWCSGNPGNLKKSKLTF